MASKVKCRDEKSKNSKSLEDIEELDLALLRKPIHTSITGLAQAKKIFDLATEELKDLLANECDLLYECKVCRNIFRSLANLISHKRVYCKEKFNPSIHGHFINVPTAANELQKIQNLEESYRYNEDVEDDGDRIPMTKDLTTIIEKISKNSALSIFSNNSELSLRKIPSSTVAVFQNINHDNKNPDNMQAEVTEISDIMSRDKAILQSDGKFKIQSHVDFDKVHENVIQISDDEDGNLKCKICDLKFSTAKTMKFHMKYKHLESRLVYPCPDCLEIFSTSWSVYRHLFKVHRKSAAQIRKLREVIQSKAFRLNNPPAFYEKHKNKSSNKSATNMTEEERMDQENQEWMDKMECSSEVPRCGGCGRAFERRAALAAHTNTCQPRHRALARREAAAVRKDYLKMPVGKVLGDVNESKKFQNEDKSPEKEDPHENENDETDDVNNDNREETKMDQDEREKESASPEPYQYIMDDIIPSIQLPFAQQFEKSNMASLKQKILKDTVLTKLLCKKCSETFDHIQKLYDHMAAHYKWMRYACKLCNFKHYSFDKLPVHVKEVHKLKGDSDFYFSTVKAIDGPEALELIESDEHINDNEVSSDSRRPSSDSSRMSEDSSPVARIDPVSKKRKIVPTKMQNAKRRKDNDGEDDASIENGDTDSVLSKTFDENSSDMDDIEERIQKRSSLQQETTVPYRRPVRKRTMPKNKDFEYDLSNLLKMEAQGYRDGQQNPTPMKNVPTNTFTKSTPAAATKIVSSSTTNPKAVTPHTNTSNKTAPSQSTNKTITPHINTAKNTQAATIKTTASKDKKERKSNTENNAQYNENIDYAALIKQCSGALTALTRKSVQKAQAHLKTSNVAVTSKRANIFMRPRDLIPKILARADKVSPKKQIKEGVDSNEAPSVIPVDNERKTDSTPQASESPIKVEQENVTDIDDNCGKSKNTTETESDGKETTEKTPVVNEREATPGNEKEQNNDSKNNADNVKPTYNIPTLSPANLRNESIEKVMSNPILNKNISELKKAGLKTKILVIKPIHRNKDGVQTLNSQLKIQTIKLKDTKKTSQEDSAGEQVLFVKVPQVDCSVQNLSDQNIVISEKATPTDIVLDNNIEKSDNIKEKNLLKNNKREEIVNSSNELKETNITTNCESSEVSETVSV